MATTKTRNARNQQPLDLAAAMPQRKPFDAEELLASLEEARRQIAEWLQVEVSKVSIAVDILDEQALSRLVMPEDTKVVLYAPTRQHRVYRSDHALSFCVVEQYEPATGTEA